MRKDELALKLYNLGLVKIGRFKLSSGLESNYYIDLRGLVNYPSFLKEIASMIYDIAREKGSFDVVAGIATGGIPLVSFISCMYEIPLAYVRRERKAYGTGRRLEGNVSSKKILLVDDVATTGGSLEEAIKVIRDNGGEVKHAIVVVDRMQGARERLMKLGVELLFLINVNELFSSLEKHGIKLNVE